MVAWAGLAALLTLAGCSDDPDAGSPAPAQSDVPTAVVPPGAVVEPAVMLNAVIRTPDALLDTGIERPATFVTARGGFVVQDTAGRVHRVVDGAVEKVDRVNPRRGLRLETNPARTHVAWATPVRGRWRVTVLHVADGSLRVLDRLRGPSGWVEQATSPSGQYAVDLGPPLRISDDGRDVTPAVPPGDSQPPVWLDPDSFALEVESAPLISPPDGEGSFVVTCSVRTGSCTPVITVVAPSNLADPGRPVRSTYQVPRARAAR